MMYELTSGNGDHPRRTHWDDEPPEEESMSETTPDDFPMPTPGAPDSAANEPTPSRGSAPGSEPPWAGNLPDASVPGGPGPGGPGPGGPGGTGPSGPGGAGLGGPDRAPATGAVRWYRSDERVVGGVAGGLADSLALDPVLVRLTFVAGAVLSLFAVPLYAAAGLLMADRRGAVGPGLIRRILGFAIGGFSIVGWYSTAEFDPNGWRFVVLLVGMAGALWYPQRRRQAIPGRGAWPPPRAHSVTGAGGPPQGGSARAAAAGAGDHTHPFGSDGQPAPADPAAGASGEWPTGTSAFPTTRAGRSRRARAPRSPLGRIVLAVALVIIALAAALDGSPQTMKIACAIAAIVCGIGLLAGAVFGRARWLIIPGLLCTSGAVVAGSVEGLGVRMGVPWNGVDRYLPVRTQADVVAIDERAGTWSLDLMQLDDDVTIRARVGVGSLIVTLPAGTEVVLNAQVGIGSINANGPDRSGYRRSLQATYLAEMGWEATQPVEPNGHRVTLDLAVGLGQINVMSGVMEEPFIAVPNVPLTTEPGAGGPFPTFRTIPAITPVVERAPITPVVEPAPIAPVVEPAPIAPVDAVTIPAVEPGAGLPPAPLAPESVATASTVAGG